MGPAFLMAVVYFGINMFYELGVVSYVVAAGLGMFLIIQDVFQ
jgi:hypothetical protein